MVTEEQTCVLVPPLVVRKGEFVCLFNKNGTALNLTCGLGDSQRRRLLPFALSRWAVGSVSKGAVVPFDQNQIKKGCVGWRAEVEITSIE